MTQIGENWHWSETDTDRSQIEASNQANGWPTWAVLIALGLTAISAYWVARGHHSLDQTVLEWEQRRMDRDAAHLEQIWLDAQRDAESNEEAFAEYHRRLMTEDSQ